MALLTHVFPTLGKIQVELFGLAAQIYKEFQKKEIKRLRCLLQLGKLAQIHSAAHHTRWDYIMLKLYLLKVFSTCPGYGLGNEVPTLNLRSGQEALQAYSLLRNFGHLNGCFETERLVLEACSRKKMCRQRLISLAPKDFRDWAKEIIDAERIFQFYQLLSVVFVANSSEFQESKELQKRCLDLLYKFLIEGDGRIQILKERHKQIRTLAYLSLDMHYAPIGIELNLGAIIASSKEFGHKIFSSSTSGFKNLNLHIDSYVNDTVYMSPDAAWAFAEFRNQTFRKFLNKIKRLKTKKQYLECLENLKRDSPHFEPRKRPVYTKFALRQAFKLPQRDEPISIANKLAEDFMMNDAEHLGLVSRPSGEISHAFIYHPVNLSKVPGLIAYRYRIISEKLAKINAVNARSNKKQGWPHFILSKNFSVSLDSLFRSVLYLITNDKYEIVLERTGVPDWCSGICSKGKHNAELLSLKILRSPFLKRLPPYRRAEIECVTESIAKASGGTISACFSNIKILRKPEFRKTSEEYEVAELDGAVLVTNCWHTKLMLVESKKQRSGGLAAARKKLQSLFRERVNLHKAFTSGIEDVIEIPKRGAFLPIRLP